MIDLSSFFFLIGILGFCLTVVACFGIVFGLKLKKGTIDLEINAEKIKGTDGLSEKIERIDYSVNDLASRVQVLEDDK